MQLMLCPSCKDQWLASSRVSALHSQLWAIEQGNLTVFSHSKTFSMLLWGQAQYRPPLSQTLGSEQTTLNRTQNGNSSSATGRPSQAAKGSQKCSKICRALQPCVVTPRKEILKRRLSTGQPQTRHWPWISQQPWNSKLPAWMLFSV